MIRRAHRGQIVQLWYAAPKRAVAPDHATIGIVAVVPRGPGPRNVGVEIEGRLVVVPSGNLRAVKGADGG